MKIYLSGPISGLPNLNRAAFEAEAERLKKLGHTVFNPCETHRTFPWQSVKTLLSIILGASCFWDWKEWLIFDLIVLIMAGFDCLALLPDWEKSPGAQIERIFAERLGMKILNAKDIL